MIKLVKVTSVEGIEQEHFDEFLTHGFEVYFIDYGSPTDLRDPHFEIHKDGKNLLSNPAVVTRSGLRVTVYEVIGPKVGAPATVISFSDRHAATVSEILYTKAGKIKGVLVQQDKATRLDQNGMSESQDYSFERNPEGPEYEARLVIPKTPIQNKLGEYGLYVNGPVKSWSYKIVVGYRREYYDYSY